MQRRKDVWGDDAEEFRPERWIFAPTSTLPSEQPLSDSASISQDDKGVNDYLKTLTHVSNPYAYIPFNAGPRICLGQSFALNEVSYTIVRILQRFPRGFELDEAAMKMFNVSGEGGRQQAERCWPRASLTMYIEACV